MINTNATAFRTNLFSMLSNTIRFNETININTKEGNAIVISEEEYNGLIATLELSSSPDLKKKILSGKGEKISDCVSLEEVDW